MFRNGTLDQLGGVAAPRKQKVMGSNPSGATNFGECRIVGFFNGLGACAASLLK